MDRLKLDAFVYPTWSNPPRPIGDLDTPHGDNSQFFSPTTEHYFRSLFSCTMSHTATRMTYATTQAVVGSLKRPGLCSISWAVQSTDVSINPDRTGTAKELPAGKPGISPEENGGLRFAGWNCRACRNKRDCPHRRRRRRLISDVCRDLRLGHNRRPQVRPDTPAGR